MQNINFLAAKRLFSKGPKAFVRRKPIFCIASSKGAVKEMFMHHVPAGVDLEILQRDLLF